MRRSPSKRRRHGKAILCEKPLALDVRQAEEMAAAVKKAGVVNMVCHNYRRIPAIALAKKMIPKGALGDRIYHFRARYAQDWIADPAFPLVWRLQVEDRRLRRARRYRRAHHRSGALPGGRDQGGVRPHGDVREGAPAAEKPSAGTARRQQNGQGHGG